MRTSGFSSAANTSTSRSMLFTAERVCAVASTRGPVSAARNARRMLSRSRNSPTMITSGSWRRALRSPWAKSRLCTPISRWLTRQPWPLWINSIGSSRVMTCNARSRLI
ncbi:hypothetical protein WR25_05641 [Diploscapter pachys]|uniref:Uncharacterized protein n=1 Tax=Diploscapter pachys TaxID=2018661 RepID=A0A2A2K318_9BILA|nr:hypothetical protein WR25_05641 [Diploscapter pachys]